ncbi:unnamed protein product [Coregonus sp. 'balchen']|nr:unnamed protein product [Coregonus sp. 'balchen']
MVSPRGALNMEVLRGQSIEELELRSNVVQVFISFTFTGCGYEMGPPGCHRCGPHDHRTVSSGNTGLQESVCGTKFHSQESNSRLESY